MKNISIILLQAFLEAKLIFVFAKNTIISKTSNLYHT